MLLRCRQQLFEVIACPKQLISKTTGTVWVFFFFVRFTKMVSNKRPQLTVEKCQQLTQLWRRSTYGLCYSILKVKERALKKYWVWRNKMFLLYCLVNTVTCKSVLKIPEADGLVKILFPQISFGFFLDCVFNEEIEILMW